MKRAQKIEWKIILNICGEEYGATVIEIDRPLCSTI